VHRTIGLTIDVATGHWGR